MSKDILKMAIKESPCIIEYKKQDIHEYTVQFFDISSAFGQWYGTAYNFETEKIRFLDVTESNLSMLCPI